MITAFSREGPKKVYVQHRLQEHAKEVDELLKQKAYFYVCGDAANMAREVNTVLAKIMSEQRGIPESKAEEIVKGMRSANQYQVCHAPLHFYSRSSRFRTFLPKYGKKNL
jgi:NADPH-ferrihemoprotein reductase